MGWLGACGLSELSHLEVWGSTHLQASKYEAGLEHELAGFAPLPCCGLVLPTSLPVEPGCAQTLQQWEPWKCSGTGTVPKVLHVSCLTSDCVQPQLQCKADFVRGEPLNFYHSFFTQWSVTYAKKGVISFTDNLASNETLNCGTRALW